MSRFIFLSLLLLAGCQAPLQDYYLDVVTTPTYRIYTFSYPHSREVRVLYYRVSDGRLERTERLDR